MTWVGPKAKMYLYLYPGVSIDIDNILYLLVPICRTVHSAEWSSVLQNGNRVDHSAEWTRPGAGVHTTTTILQIGIAETFLQMGIA